MKHTIITQTASTDCSHSSCPKRERTRFGLHGQARTREHRCMHVARDRQSSHINADETHLGRTSNGIYTTQLDRSADILYVKTVSK